MTPTEPTHRRSQEQPETPADLETPASVVQVEEGAFMNLTSALQSIHLKVWVTVPNTGTLRMEPISLTDERALVHGAGRLFAGGAAEDAMKQVRQAQSGFQRKKSDWERRVRQSEDDSARRRAMRELQQKKANHNPINTRITPAENQFRRLIEALDVQISLERKRELAAKRKKSNSTSSLAADQGRISLPAGFLDTLYAAGDDRGTIVNRFFDVEAVLTVEVTSAESQPTTVVFTPPLPKNRLYYFVDAGQVVRLRRVKITRDVFYYNYETRQNEKIALASLIEYVRAGGVWLLRPKSD